MQEGCKFNYTIDDLFDLKVPQKAIVMFRQQIENLKVAKDKSLKWCPTPDCHSQVKKPCCCKNRAMCTECAHEMCF